MSPMPRTFSFLSRHAPYGSTRPQLCLDVALATAVFEQTVHYIFVDDGVYQLLRNQDPQGIRCKTLGKALQALELYGIERVYVDRHSLTSRGLDSEQLLLPAKQVNAPEIADLLAQSHYVFSL